MGTNLSSVSIDNVWATNTYATPPVDGTAVIQCYSCNGVSVSKNHVLGAGIIFTGTTASGYSYVNSANLSQDIQIDNNFVDGQSKTVDLADLTFTKYARMTNNIVQDAQFGLQWWGGNAQTDGASLNNTRWAQDITVNGLRAYNVRSAAWGGMGQDITVDEVVANKCSDVCLEWFRVKLEESFVPGQTTRGWILHPGYEHVRWEALIEKMEPERLFSFNWPHARAFDKGTFSPDYSEAPRTRVEFRLEETASGTLLVLSESGFETLPDDFRAEAFRRNEGGWIQQMKNIENYVARAL